MGTRQVEGSTTTHVSASPDEVFATVTNVERLTEWNDRIEALESPPRPLVVGDHWVVRMRLPGKRFSSISEVLELDGVTRRFSYRSKPDDANPSHTVWTWRVDDAGDGTSRVTVSWSLRPRTFGRHIAVAIRRRMIPSEVAASTRRLAAVATRRTDA